MILSFTFFSVPLNSLRSVHEIHTLAMNNWLLLQHDSLHLLLRIYLILTGGYSLAIPRWGIQALLSHDFWILNCWWLLCFGLSLFDSHTFAALAILVFIGSWLNFGPFGTSRTLLNTQTWVLLLHLVCDLDVLEVYLPRILDVITYRRGIGLRGTLRVLKLWNIAESYLLNK